MKKLNREERNHIKAIQRRIDFLSQEIKANKGMGTRLGGDYDAAERAALKFALAIIKDNCE
jgi:hypothetical protein